MRIIPQATIGLENGLGKDRAIEMVTHQRKKLKGVPGDIRTEYDDP